jgi:hypothetical protein
MIRYAGCTAHHLPPTNHHLPPTTHHPPPTTRHPPPVTRHPQVNYKIVDEFWHSELASDPDNQNKEKVGIYLGVDAKGNVLYDLHPRRAQTGNLNTLLGKFRKSEFGARFRATTATKKRPRGAQLGRRQLAEARCLCIKKRKATQCDCQLCTYMEENLAHMHKARRGWHSAKRQKLVDGDKGPACHCHIHRWLAPSSMEEEEEEAVWHTAAAAACEPDDASLERWMAATAAAAAVRGKRARALKYDGMTASPDALLDALHPCGKKSYPDYSVTNASFFRSYDRACAEGSCPKTVFDRSNACEWENVFGADCPLESSDEKYDWWDWSKQLRGTDRDGKPFYSLEWMPRRGGTRAEHFKELRVKAKLWRWHMWRDHFLKHSLRVFDDRRSGAAVLALRQRVSGPLLLSAAFEVLALHSEECERERRAAVMGPQYPRALAAFRARTFAILTRLADVDSARHRPSAETVAKLQRTEKVHTALANTTHIKSDYAAQVETKRSHTATCATMERHCLEVVVVGFGPYQQARSTARKQRQPQKREVAHAALTQTDRNVFVLSAPPTSTASASVPPRPAEVRFVHKQHVYVFYAFHGAGFKPSARSHNVVRCRKTSTTFSSMATSCTASGLRAASAYLVGRRARRASRCRRGSSRHHTNRLCCPATTVSSRTPTAAPTSTITATITARRQSGVPRWPVGPKRELRRINGRRQRRPRRRSQRR